MSNQRAIAKVAGLLEAMQEALMREAYEHKDVFASAGYASKSKRYNQSQGTYTKKPGSFEEIAKKHGFEKDDDYSDEHDSHYFKNADEHFSHRHQDDYWEHTDGAETADGTGYESLNKHLEDYHKK